VGRFKSSCKDVIAPDPTMVKKDYLISAYKTDVFKEFFGVEEVGVDELFKRFFA
jgi:hypothetical protein